MGNEYTKEQVRKFLEEAVRKSKNPDMRAVMKEKRRKKSFKVAQKFGL